MCIHHQVAARENSGPNTYVIRYMTWYYYACVLILLYVCPDRARRAPVRPPPHTTTYLSSYCSVCPHMTICVSSYYLHMCPATAVYVLIRRYVCLDATYKCVRIGHGQHGIRGRARELPAHVPHCLQALCWQACVSKFTFFTSTIVQILTREVQASPRCRRNTSAFSWPIDSSWRSFSGIYMYVYTYIYSGYECTNMYICTCIHTHHTEIHTHTHTHTHTHILYVCMHVCVRERERDRERQRERDRERKRERESECVCVYVYVCMYVCIYIGWPLAWCSAGFCSS
jgi:hypothetical protein